MERALGVAPNNAEFLNARGTIRLLRGEDGDAIADFSKAIMIKPSYALAYNHRGVAFCRAGQRETGIADLQTALELDPSGPAGDLATKSLEKLGAAPKQ